MLLMLNLTLKMNRSAATIVLKDLKPGQYVHFAPKCVRAVIGCLVSYDCTMCLHLHTGKVNQMKIEHTMHQPIPACTKSCLRVASSQK
jgi:hypothetical protein